MFVYTRLAFVLLFVLLRCPITHAQVTITSVTPTTVCAGSSITVAFTNTDTDRSSFSLYLYSVQSADSLAIGQPTYISGNGSLSGYIPANQPNNNYRAGVKKVSSNGILSITKSDSFSINAMPPAPSVNATVVTYCEGSFANSLTATAVSGGSLLWYSSQIGGSGISLSPTPSTMTPGSSTYYVSQVVSGCESLRIPISVVVRATPPPPTVTASLVYCQGVQASPLSASGSNLNWYASPTGGTALTSITPITTFAGVFHYYVSQTINGCESPRSSITVIITPAPSPPSVTSITYCQGSTPTALAVRASNGSTVYWYTTPTSGSATLSAPLSPSVVGITTFYVSQAVNSCESSRAALTVTVMPKPTVTLTADELTLTPNHSSIFLTATASTSLLVWSTGDTTSSITVNNPRDYSVTVKDGDGCSATGSITIDQSPVEIVYSVKAGDWNDPSVWSTNQVPTNNYAVRFHHVINIPAGYQAQAQALRYRPGGQVQLNTGSYIKTGS